jgi:hypothetical protein
VVGPREKTRFTLVHILGLCAVTALYSTRNRRLFFFVEINFPKISVTQTQSAKRLFYRWETFYYTYMHMLQSGVSKEMEKVLCFNAGRLETVRCQIYRLLGLHTFINVYFCNVYWDLDQEVRYRW